MAFDRCSEGAVCKWTYLLAYRVVQNKPDYLLVLPTFYISITKHVSMITYV